MMLYKGPKFRRKCGSDKLALSDVNHRFRKDPQGQGRLDENSRSSVLGVEPAGHVRGGSESAVALLWRGDLDNIATTVSLEATQVRQTTTVITGRFESDVYSLTLSVRPYVPHNVRAWTGF